MPYNAGVPATGHSASQDYNDMRGNFQQIQNSFSANHEPLGVGGGIEGFHTKVQMPAVITDPGLASPAGSIYMKTFGGKSQLFFQNDTLPANVAQLTGNLVNDGSNLTVASEFTVETPWNITFKFGFTQPVATGTPINLVSAFPNNFLGVIITPRLGTFAQSGANITLNPSQFTVYFSTGGNQTLYFFAWGN